MNISGIVIKWLDWSPSHQYLFRYEIMNISLALGIFNIYVCLVHFVSFSKLDLSSNLWKKVRIKVMGVLIFRASWLKDIYFASCVTTLFYHRILAAHLCLVISLDIMMLIVQQFKCAAILWHKLESDTITGTHSRMHICFRMQQNTSGHKA